VGESVCESTTIYVFIDKPLTLTHTQCVHTHFTALPLDEQVAVLKRMTLRTLQPQESLYVQGTKTVFNSTHFFFVLSGSVSVHHR
jgi:hypothetical protein